MRRVRMLALWAFTASVAVAMAQMPSAPACDAVMTNPSAFVGKPVSFFGSMTGFDMKFINGKSVTINTWACKSRDGQLIAGGAFGFLSTESKFTPAAGKVDTTKTLFVVTGTVRDPKNAPAEAGSIPLLTNVQIKLASESP